MSKSKRHLSRRLKLRKRYGRLVEIYGEPYCFHGHARLTGARIFRRIP